MVRSRAAAQALLWLALALPMFVSIAGLAIDGAVLLSTRRELQSVADGAARAGATRLDMARLRASGGSDVQLDPSLAGEAARGYVQDALLSAPAMRRTAPDLYVDVTARRVHVLVRASVPTAFLRIAHIDSAPVEASAYADVQYGIHDGAGG
jgi:uncharacterized membrane protein